ncbi:MAG: hypothetical protein IID45_07935, partial [Planctomycetes bacterium]|nr:hypothetical protein [Planctomycetota bacterium]
GIVNSVAQGVSELARLVPGVGVIIDIKELSSGRDLFTGRKLSVLERVLAGILLRETKGTQLFF